MSSHGRSSSQGSGWFHGTMEVISGMAPRPSTPQPHAARSMSAPNSPARNVFPGIGRLPSQDSLDRSIHNESGHGKSTAQIVRDLKASNSALMAKQAKLEVKFMNDLADVTKSFEEQRRQLDDQAKLHKRQLVHLESYRVAADNKIKENEGSLSKVREESAFQRHTISDLKNQLYQLQGVMEEQELDKGEDMERLFADNQEMAREISRLQEDLAQAERRLDGDQPADSYYHQWQDTSSELEHHRKRLSVSENTLQGLKAERESIKEDHAIKVDQLASDMEEQSSSWQRRERDLQAQIETLEFTDSKVSMDLRRELEERDDSVAELQMQLDQYAEKAAEFAAMLEQSRKDAHNQDQYRRDEVEDLRILHDAQEEEITNLRKDLDDATRELEMRDDELEETNAQLKGASVTSDSMQEIERLRKELNDSQKELGYKERQLERTSSDLELAKKQQIDAPESEGDSNPVFVHDLEDKVSKSDQAVGRLEKETAEANKEHQRQLTTLQATVDDVVKDKDEISKQLQALQKEKDDAVSNLKEKSDEFSKLKNHWEHKSGAVQEVGALRKEIAIHEQRVQVNVQELEASQAKTVANAKQIKSLEQEIKSLRDSIHAWESGASSNKLKKQLREAQIALVALDDEKKKITSKHRELLSAVEKKKEEILRDTKERLTQKDQELEMQKTELQRVETEKRNLTQRIKSLESTLPPPPPKIQSRGLPNSNFDSTLQKLKGERDAFKIKLKDRDTTIAALVKSSVSLEQKISSMEDEVHSVRSGHFEEKKVSESELLELRKAVAASKERDPRATDNIAVLQKQVKTAKADSKRWKKALQGDGSTGSEYRFQISMLQKELEDYVEKVQERDRAIENLVNQSMSQEAHVKDLKIRLSSLMKEVETVRHQRPKYDDVTLRAEIRRLQQESEMFAGQIIEQDEELQNLKRDLQHRNEQVFSLKKEVSRLKAVGNKIAINGKTAGEVSVLKKQLSQVQSDLRARDLQLTHIKNDMEESKKGSGDSDAKKVMNLQAALDELQEASESNRAELRDLRKQLREAKEAAGAASDLKIELAQVKYAFDEFKRQPNGEASNSDIQRKLDEALANNKGLEQKMAQQNETIRRNKNEAVDKLEALLQDRESKIQELQKMSSSLNEDQINVFQKEIESLRKDLDTKTEALGRLEKKLKDKDAALEKSENLKLKLVGELSDTKTSFRNLQEESAAMRNIAVDDEKESLTKEKQELSKAKAEMCNEIADLKKELESLGDLKQGNAELKCQLVEAVNALETSEKSIVDSYQKELTALALDRDVTVDTLRKDLAEARGQRSDSAAEMVHQQTELQKENIGLRAQFEVELQAKNQQLYALEHTLHAQEQIIESMRSEMDQLQSGMEQRTERRRGEVEDLQQEVMQIESRAMKQEREIIAFKMRLEESKLEHKAEVVRLKDVIVTMEKESPLAKTVAELQNDDRMLAVRERLEQLKARNTTLQEENLKLGGRLERAVIEIKSFEGEKEHADEMDHENSGLRRQVKELESILSKMQRPQSSSSRTPADKENNGKSKDKSTAKQGQPIKQNSKKGLKGLFKRRGFTSDETIKEEKEEEASVKTQ